MVILDRCNKSKIVHSAKLKKVPSHLTDFDVVQGILLNLSTCSFNKWQHITGWDPIDQLLSTISWMVYVQLTNHNHTPRWGFFARLGHNTPEAVGGTPSLPASPNGLLYPRGSRDGLPRPRNGTSASSSGVISWHHADATADEVTPQQSASLRWYCPSLEKSIVGKSTKQHWALELLLYWCKVESLSSWNTSSERVGVLAWRVSIYTKSLALHLINDWLSK